MDMNPIDRGISQTTPVRMPESLKLDENGKVAVESSPDKVEISTRKPRTKDGILANTTKTVLAGFGLGSGLVGGAAVGSGLAAGGDMMSGLVGHSLSWASVSTAAKVGGVVGAAIFGVAGTFGGWSFASGLIKSGTFFKNLVLDEHYTEDEAQALKILKGAEDTSKDAKQVLRYIAKNRAADEKATDEAQIYCGLLSLFTNKDTEKALSAYAALKEYLPPGKDREGAVSELGELAKTFGTPSDAMDALYMTLQNRRSQESLAGESGNLRLVAEGLKGCSVGHAAITPDIAGTVYNYFKNSVSPEERREVISSTLGELGKLNIEPKDAIGILEPIVGSREKGEDLKAETHNYLGLLSKLGNDSSSAKMAYREIKRYLPPGAERYNMLPELDRLSQVFGREALDSLFIVLKGLNAKDTLAGETASLTGAAESLLQCSSEGERITPEAAGEVYAFLKSSFPPEKRKEAQDATLGQFAQVKMKPDDAVAHLKAIVTSLQAGESLATETQNFLGFLKAVDYDGDLARTAYTSVKKYLPPDKGRDQVLDELGRFTAAFGDARKAIDALEIVLPNLKKSESFADESQFLRSVADSLRSCTKDKAAITAKAAGEAYLTLKESYGPGERKAALSSTLDRFGKDSMDFKDAIENLKTLIKYQGSADDLSLETDQLMALRGHTDGDLDAARKLYAMTRKNLSPGDERAQGLAEFDHFKEVFGNTAGGLQAIGVVIGSLTSKETLAGESETLRAMADGVKKCSTPGSKVSSQVACDVYSTLKSHFTPDERQGAVEATLGKFGNYRKLDPPEVDENLALLVTSLHKGDDLARETDFLMVLPERTGQRMDRARQVYSAAKKSLPSEEERSQVPDELARFEKTFRSNDEAINALNIILATMNAGDRLAVEADVLRRDAELLRTCAGGQAPISTDQAKEAYTTIKASFAPAERDGIMKATLEKFPAYMKLEPREALENLKLLVSSLKDREDMAAETGFLMALPDKTGGSMEAARKVYGMAKQSLPPGEVRNSVPSELSRFAGIFGSPQSAIEALDLTLNGLARSENFSQEADNLRACAQHLKNCTGQGVSPANAQAAYSLFDARFAPTERPQAMEATMGQFGNFTKLGFDDSMENLKMLLETRQKGEDLRSETGTLMGLLKQTGGKMADARTIYGAAKKYLPPGPERNAVPDELSRLAQTFGSTGEGVNALVTVLKNMKSNESFTGEADTLRFCAESLRQCTSGYQSVPLSTASDVYLTVQKCFDDDQRRNVINATLGQLGKYRKLSADDAVRTFKYLLESRCNGEDLQKETAMLMDLTEKAGGSLDSGRKIYNSIRTRFSPQSRDEGLRSFAALQSLESSADDALDTFLGLHEDRHSDEDFSQCVNGYRDLYRACGYSGNAHRSAMNIYKYLSSSFRSGYERDGARSAMERLLNAERGVGGADGAKSDFQFVYSHMESGDNLPQQIDTFIGFLQSERNSERAQQKFVDSKFRETWR
jgi:hypothetical protein